MYQENASVVLAMKRLGAQAVRRFKKLSQENASVVFAMKKLGAQAIKRFRKCPRKKPRLFSP